MALLLALAAACGGGDDSDARVASADGEEAAEAGSQANGGSDGGEVTEEEMLEYTECLRAQGVDVADPRVDADGNVAFGGPAGGLNPQDQEAFAEFRGQLQAAQEVCGPPPGGGFAGGGGQDQTELQDQMLALAECLRDQGIDVPDPDFGNLGEGGTPGQGGGPFGDIDRTDPEFQAAFEECQDVFTGGPFGPGGPGGGQTDDASEG